MNENRHGRRKLPTEILACSKRSDSGERCEVKIAIKSRGGLTAPHYLNAWNRLPKYGQTGNVKPLKRKPQTAVCRFSKMTKSHLGIQTFFPSAYSGYNAKSEKRARKRTLGTNFQTTGRILAGNHT